MNDKVANSGNDYQQMMYVPVPGARMAPYGGYNEGAAVVLPHGREEGYSDQSLRQFFSMLLRRRGIFLGVLALVLGVTITYLSLSPPVYMAIATMQVMGGAKEGSEDDSATSSLVMSGAPAVDRSIATQLTVIKSDSVRRLAMDRITDDAVRAKLKNFNDVQFEMLEDTNLIDVKVSSHDPSASAQYANAICDAYEQFSRAQNRSQVQTALNYLTTQKDKIGAKLELARSDLQRYKEKYGIFDLNSSAGGVMTDVTSAKSQLEATRAERFVGAAEYNSIASMIPKMPMYEHLPGSTAIRPEFTALRSKIIDLNMQKSDLSQKYRADHPKIKLIDQQIKEIEDEMKGEVKTEIASWSNSQNPVRKGLEGKLVDLRVSNISLEAKETALNQAMARATSKMATLPTREREMTLLIANVAALNDSFDTLRQKQEGLRMIQEARVANASKLFPAETPKSPMGRMARFLASALMIGLLMALLLSALVDWLDDGVYNEFEAKMVSQLPILAQIPQVSRDTQHSMLTAADAPAQDRHLAHLRENFRMLRTVIALSAPVRPVYALPVGNGALDANGAAAQGSAFGGSAIRSVVITSSLPNEGKSVSATNLAISAALSGERVLLIDCDLRHPGLHEFFGLTNDIGLTNVVSGACTLDEAVQTTRIPTLQVLTTGPVIAEPLQVLNSPGARALFSQIESEFDFSVFDAPPALVFAEAQVIAAMTDAMLLVISSQDAKKREVARTRELFDQSGLNPLGAILNKLPPGSDGYYYGRYMEQYGQ